MQQYVSFENYNLHVIYIFGIKCFQNPNRTIFPEFGTGQYIS